MVVEAVEAWLEESATHLDELKLYLSHRTK